MAVDLTELGAQLAAHRPFAVPAWPGIRRAGVALVLRASCYRHEARVIWGLTLGIVGELGRVALG